MERNDREHSRGWRWGASLGRAKWGLQVWCHHSHLGDRWVFQPKFLWDRKSALSGREVSSDG